MSRSRRKQNEARPFTLCEQPTPYATKTEGPAATSPQPEQNLNEAKFLPAQALFEVVGKILKHELTAAKTETEIADLLNVSKSQSKAWLTKLVEDGQLEQRGKPVRYRTTGIADRLL